MNDDDLLLQRYRQTLNLGGVGLLFAVAAATWFVIVRPIQQDILAEKTTLREQAHFLTTTTATLEAESSLIAKLTSAQAEHAAACVKVPDTAQPNAFLNELDELARAAQLSVSDFSPREVLRTPRWSEQKFQIVGTGSYASVCQFLDGLKTVARLCRVRALHITSPPGQTNGAAPKKLQVTFDVRVYFDVRDSDLAVAAAPTGGQQ